VPKVNTELKLFGLLSVAPVLKRALSGFVGELVPGTDVGFIQLVAVPQSILVAPVHVGLMAEKANGGTNKNEKKTNNRIKDREKAGIRLIHFIISIVTLLNPLQKAGVHIAELFRNIL
jgi:hypothetical protein